MSCGPQIVRKTVTNGHGEHLSGTPSAPVRGGITKTATAGQRGGTQEGQEGPTAARSLSCSRSEQGPGSPAGPRAVPAGTAVSRPRLTRCSARSTFEGVAAGPGRGDPEDRTSLREPPTYCRRGRLVTSALRDPASAWGRSFLPPPPPPPFFFFFFFFSLFFFYRVAGAGASLHREAVVGRAKPEARANQVRGVSCTPRPCAPR